MSVKFADGTDLSTREITGAGLIAAGSLPDDRELRVLLIDDDEDEFVLLRRALERGLETRYRVEWTPAYDAGLAAIARCEHDAYLIDHRLGAGTGVDLIEEASAAGCAAPLILLTGQRDPTLDAAALRAGAADFLVKGKTDPALLDRTLRYAIAHARLAAALARSRDQIMGLEEVSRLLSDEGPTPAARTRVVDLLVDRFGYSHVSLFLASGSVLRLVASRGYAHPVDSIDFASGIVERLTRIPQARFIPSISVDPDHRHDENGVNIELSVPLFVSGECAGLLNVASPDSAPLGEADHNAIMAVADRLAMALSLRREQQELSARVARFRALAKFTSEVNAAPDDALLPQKVADAVRLVVPADSVVLCLADTDGRYVVRATSGGPSPATGSEAVVGDGVMGRAIAECTMVVSDRGVGEAAVPLMRDGRAVGALAFFRSDDRTPFSYLEREALPLVADQVTLALRRPSNDAAVRDDARVVEVAGAAALTAGVSLLARSASAGLSVVILQPQVEGADTSAAPGPASTAAVEAVSSAAASEGAGTLVGRYGAAGVSVVLSMAADATAAAIARIRARASAKLPPGVNLSVGYAAVGAPVRDVPSLVARAAGALVLANRAGRNLTVEG